MFWTPENPRARKAADPHRRFPRSRQPRRGGAPLGALKARAEQRTTSFFWRESCPEIARPARGRPPSGAFDCRCRKGRGPPLRWDRSRSLAADADWVAPPCAGSRPAAEPPRPGDRLRPPACLGDRPQPRRPPPRLGGRPQPHRPPDSWLPPAVASPPAPRRSPLANSCSLAAASLHRPPRASTVSCDRGPRAVTDSLDLGAPYRSCELRQEPRRRFSARSSPAFGDGLAMECFT